METCNNSGELKAAFKTIINTYPYNMILYMYGHHQHVYGDRFLENLSEEEFSTIKSQLNVDYNGIDKVINTYLSSRDKKIVFDHFVSHKQIKDIACELEMSTNGVRQIINKIMARLKWARKSFCSITIEDMDRKIAELKGADSMENDVETENAEIIDQMRGLLSRRAYNGIVRSEWGYDCKIKTLTFDDLTKLRNVGIVSQLEIINAFQELGFEMKGLTPENIELLTKKCEEQRASHIRHVEKCIRNGTKATNDPKNPDEDFVSLLICSGAHTMLTRAYDKFSGGRIMYDEYTKARDEATNLLENERQIIEERRRRQQRDRTRMMAEREFERDR